MAAGASCHCGHVSVCICQGAHFQLLWVCAQAWRCRSHMSTGFCDQLIDCGDVSCLPLGLFELPGWECTQTVSVGPARSHPSSTWSWPLTEGPAAQLSCCPSCLPSWSSLEVPRKARVWVHRNRRWGQSQGFRYRSGVCTASPPLGSLQVWGGGLGEPLISGVCLSSLLRCLAKKEPGVSLLPWQLGSCSSPADAQSRRLWAPAALLARS